MLTIITTEGEVKLETQTHKLSDEQLDIIESLDDRNVVSYLVEYKEGTPLKNTHDFEKSTPFVKKITVTLE